MLSVSDDQSEQLVLQLNESGRSSMRPDAKVSNCILEKLRGSEFNYSPFSHHFPDYIKFDQNYANGGSAYSYQSPFVFSGGDSNPWKNFASHPQVNYTDVKSNVPKIQE